MPGTSVYAIYGHANGGAGGPFEDGTLLRVGALISGFDIFNTGDLSGTRYHYTWLVQVHGTASLDAAHAGDHGSFSTDAVVIGTTFAPFVWWVHGTDGGPWDLTIGPSIDIGGDHNEVGDVRLDYDPRDNDHHYTTEWPAFDVTGTVTVSWRELGGWHIGHVAVG